MSLQKQKRIESKKATQSAKGEECTLNTLACCYDAERTVLCHLPDGSGTGKMGGKSDDVGCAIYACYPCHLELDNRKSSFWLSGEAPWLMLLALKRTIRRMIENGVIGVK